MPVCAENVTGLLYRVKGRAARARFRDESNRLVSEVVRIRTPEQPAPRAERSLYAPARGLPVRCGWPPEPFTVDSYCQRQRWRTTEAPTPWACASHSRSHPSSCTKSRAPGVALSLSDQSRHHRPARAGRSDGRMTAYCVIPHRRDRVTTSGTGSAHCP